MYKKSSIKYFILFFTGIFLYAPLAIFIGNKPSHGLESSINTLVSKNRKDKLIKLENQHQVDLFYYDDDNEDDTDPKVKSNCFFIGSYSIAKTLFFSVVKYSLAKFKTSRSSTKKIFLFNCVFRL
jgi:hypothetical protein